MNLNKFKTEGLYDVFVLGFLTLGVQIVLFREFLLIYSNNELVLGLLFFLWLIFTAAGAGFFKYFKRKQKIFVFVNVIFLFLAFYPPAAAFSIEYFRNSIIPAGRMISLNEIILFSSIILFPFCFLSGLLFMIINYNAKDKIHVKKFYSFESLGSLTGGALVSFLFIYILGTANFKILQYLLFFVLIYLILKQIILKRIFITLIFTGLTIVTFVFYANTEVEKIARQSLFKGQKVIATKETYFGNITVTKTGNQLNVFENGVLLFSTSDVIQKEEDVHFGMSQRTNAKSVLLAGGGVTGTALEILKYPHIKRVDYIEQNPYIIETGRKFTANLKSDKIKVIISDPVKYLHEKTAKYDIVFVNQPPPLNAAQSRFYTVEFYKNIKNIMQRSAVLSTRVPYSENYASDDELKLQEAIYNGLKSNFKNVLVVPAHKLYFLASDSVLNFNFTKAIAETGIKNKYFKPGYIMDNLLKFKSNQILKTYNDKNIVNRNFKPLIYYLYLKHWLSFFKFNIIYLILAVLLSVILLLILLKPGQKAMFTSGFTASATEVLILLAFQIISGYMYLMLGIMASLFMSGLAVGSYTGKNIKQSPGYKNTSLLQLTSGLLLTAMALILLTENLTFIYISLFITIFIIAFLTGKQYSFSVSTNEKSLQNSYSVDLLGAALGGLLPVILLIPQFGIVNTFFILAGLHLLVSVTVITK